MKPVLRYEFVVLNEEIPRSHAYDAMEKLESDLNDWTGEFGFAKVIHTSVISHEGELRLITVLRRRNSILRYLTFCTHDWLFSTLPFRLKRCFGPKIANGVVAKTLAK